jgi:hypothetical protein
MASSIPLPSSIVFTDPQSPVVSVHETDYAQTGAFDVIFTITDPKTGVKNTDYTLSVTILCTKAIVIASGAVSDFSYQIDLDAPWTKYVPLPQYAPDPAQCVFGTYTFEVLYSGSPFPAFINQHPTTQLVVATQNVGLIGDYPLKIKVTESISGLVNDIDSFVLSILEPTYTQSLELVAGTQINDFTYTITNP